MSLLSLKLSAHNSQKKTTVKSLVHCTITWLGPEQVRVTKPLIWTIPDMSNFFCNTVNGPLHLRVHSQRGHICCFSLTQRSYIGGSWVANWVTNSVFTSSGWRCTCSFPLITSKSSWRWREGRQTLWGEAVYSSAVLPLGRNPIWGHLQYLVMKIKNSDDTWFDGCDHGTDEVL